MKDPRAARMTSRSILRAIERKIVSRSILRAIERETIFRCLMVALAVLLLIQGASARQSAAESQQVTAIVQFEEEPLARFLAHSPMRNDPALARRLHQLQAKHAEFEENVARLIPEARVRARFATVLSGVAVTLPAGEVSSLRRFPGVVQVSPTRKFRPVLDSSVTLIGAPALWSALGGAGNAGLGKKIAIVDTGIDSAHPFLTDNSLATPVGFPKGDVLYTSNKVIVAKAYPPPAHPFSPRDLNGHGTHVAGIAAGINGYSGTLSGVAPKAFLMNYNVFGDIGEADTTELVQAIDDAVSDGADVVNLSLGGPATGLDDPLVVAVRNGVSAGVVFAIAAGNSSGSGTILSPGITPEAITVGATTKGDSIASFSSRGPSIDLTIKPDVMAPGVSIKSSIPGGNLTYKSGTSMSTPHVAGAAALLRQLNPSWTPSQVKSALVNTAVFTATASLSGSSVMDRGAGRIDLGAAASPGITIDPPSHSFGIGSTKPSGYGTTKAFTVQADAEGAGTWTIEITPIATASGLTASLSSPSVLAPNGTATFSLTLSAAEDTPVGDYEGYVSLRKGTRWLHIPYWVRLVPYRTWLLPVYKNGVEPP